MIDLAESARHTPLQLRLWLPLGRQVVKFCLWLLGPVRNRGAYRVPAKGGLLVVANHLSDIDPIVVQASCPRPIHFMAKSELFSMRFIGRMQRAFGAFPVNRDTPDRAALRFSASLLREGEVVGIFPEGQLSEDGELQPIKPGVALIARLVPSASVICCGLKGTSGIVPYGKVVPRRSPVPVEVIWGEPKQFEAGASTEQILAWIEGELRSLTQ